jgi:hypothetical protein
MATATLVNSDIEIGRRIVATLTRANIPVTVYLWAFVPQLQEWQLIVGTPLVDNKGPLAAYAEVNRTLRKEGLFDDVPLRRIILRSPNDRVLKSLEKESRAVPHEVFRVVNAPIAGNFVEDAYLYTGFIHIVRLQGRADQSIYSVIYAPYGGPGGVVPSRKMEGDEALRSFLADRLHIDQEWSGLALRSLDERGSASIPNVEFKGGDLKRLGLA